MTGRTERFFPSALTFVELTFAAGRLEHWLRFGSRTSEEKISNERRIVGFAPNAVFAFVRWASNDYGTILSHIDIVRAVLPGEVYQTLPFVRPGGEILLKIAGWPKVERVLQAIDAIEALRINPAHVSPDYWRHVHNRLTVDQPYRAYTLNQHKAFLLRRRIAP